MTAEKTIPNVELRSGATTVPMPQLGFGVFQVDDDEATPAVAEALKDGYRSIDTAAIYGNEAGVGRALAESDLSDDQVFLTTKLWNSAQGFDQALAAFEESHGKLGRPIDLYLIHWPVPERGQFIDSYRAMMQLREQGKVRAIGVSNFNIEHLEQLHDAVGEYPAINQVELHPNFQQTALREFHDAHGIVTEAWSPLGQGGDILSDGIITDIASQYGKTPAQVIIRWHLQLGNVVIPKSVTPKRIAENIDVFDFELSDLAMKGIATLDNGKRLGPDPATFNA